MDNCKENIELISMLIDGELDETQASELRAHIDQCETCKKVFDAFLSISDSLSEDLVEPPEMLAKGVMFKVNLMEQGKSKPRFAYGRFTAIAACLAIILIGASRFGLLSGGIKMEAAAPKGAESQGALEEMAADQAPAAGAETEKSSLLGEDFFESLVLNLNKSAADTAEAPAESGHVAQFGMALVPAENDGGIIVSENDFLLFLTGLIDFADENDPENTDTDFAFYRSENGEDTPVELRLYEGEYQQSEENGTDTKANKDEQKPLAAFADLSNIRTLNRFFEDAEETDKTFDTTPTYTVLLFDKDGKSLPEEDVAPLRLWLAEGHLYFQTEPEAKIMRSSCKTEELIKLLESFK